jgi:diaminopimelate epimerase
MKLSFYKYHGTGNDFIIIDNREHLFPYGTELIRHLCDRRFGIGADGLMTLTKVADYPFAMRYYNSDGNESSMCGNGGRCIVAFANKLGIIKEGADFLAIDGPHEAYIPKSDYVKLRMQDVEHILQYGSDFFADTGSPHYVKFMDEIDTMDVRIEGRKVRYSKEFGNDGTNVNFVKVLGNGEIKMRTYERGVEDETWSCGTGTVASAIITSFKFQHDINSFSIQAPGGTLKVLFERKGPEEFRNIWLEGPALFVYQGDIEI